MKKEVLDNMTAGLLGENRFLKLVLAVIALSNVVFGYMAMKAVSYRTTVLVPFGLNEQVVVSDRVVSQKYLLYMAREVFDLALDYTPPTVRKQYELLLTIVSPKTYRRYEKRFEKFVEEAEVGKLVSVVLIDEITHDPEQKMVVMQGQRLLMLEAGDAMERKAVRYAFTYEIRQGRLFVIDIGEYKEGKIGKLLD